ncbi:dockerin type I domain-containing protein [Paraglaciecola sp.]|uniref:dockerin type I domain-containing protein n=1 Tax=Paraglaciecola sp. TaxID=1920173 RepID=UPI0030F46423
MFKRSFTWLNVLLVSMSSAAFAENSIIQDGDPREENNSFRTLLLSRSSPFDPPTENTFVADSGPGLDTGCTFNNSAGHPLLIDIIIDKAVGPVDGNGYLLDPNKFIAQGVIPSSVGVLMPAFDVDVNGSPPPERNEALLNGNVLGILNGNDGIWSLNNFSIDVRKLKFPSPGSATGAINQVQINIDTLSSGRWCTAIDWVALNIEIKPIVALTLTPTGNNPVWKDSANQITKIYEQSIDANCDLVADNSSVKEKPFSAAGGAGNAVVEVDTKLATCGGSSAIASADIEANWSIQGTAKQGSSRWTGDAGKVSISVPKEIGAYMVDFEYKVDGNPLPKITRTLYVTKSAPTISKPLAFWYEKATDWASGQTVDSNILTEVLQGLYTYGGNNWDYGYYFGAASKCDWKQLMSDPISCNYSDCYVFSDVFENMSGLLGVGGLSTIRKVGSGALGLFVTNASPSLDTSFPGSAKPVGGAYDRYLFSSHSLRLRSGSYYDATFNGVYASDNAFIAWNAQSVGNDARGAHYVTLEGAKIYPYVPPSPNKYETTWGAFKYIAPAPIAPPFQGVTHLGATSEMLSSVAVNTTFEPIDDGNDGRYDKLNVTIAIEFPTAGFYNISAQLTKNGVLIANRPAFNDARPVGVMFNAPFAGTHNVEMEFSGQQIFDSANDGPYELKGMVLGFASEAIEITATSPAYQYTEFGELDALITNLSEETLDSDNDTLFDFLQVNVDLNAYVAGEYWLKATLLGGADSIENVVLPVTLIKGANSRSITFSGVRIYRSEVDGSYEVVVSLTRQDDEALGSLTLQTSSYRYSEFEALVDLLGNLQSQGIDTNNNGLFEQLSVTLPVEARTTGLYTLNGVLTGVNGEKSVFFESNIQLLDTTDTLQFIFDGKSINQLQMNGPYRLSFSLKEQNTDYVSDSIVVGSTTAGYTFDDFESDAVNTSLTLTGETSDSGVDTNNNALFDQLQVNIGIKASVSGFYSWSASLIDVLGSEIELSSGGVSLQAGNNQINIPFDGRLIGANAVAGPFYVKNLLVFSSNGANLVATDVTSTKHYAADNFENYVTLTKGDFDGDGDVDRNDLTLLIGQLNQAINSSNTTMDLDQDGRITVVDARHLRLLCTRPYCAL